MTAIARLSRFIETRTGITLSETLMNRLAGFVRVRSTELGAASVDAYVDAVELGRDADEYQSLIDLITIGKTSFFRHAAQFDAIANEIVPALAKLVPANEPIRIWSAACATGEEVYSMAMALDACGWFERRDIQLIGSDINSASLRVAERARYYLDAQERKQLPDAMWKYFALEGDGFVVTPRIRERVTFEQRNLRALYTTDPGLHHLVLCRNVLIYFSEAVRNEVIRAIAQRMAPHAALLFGSAEHVPLVSRHLTTARVGDTFVHLKGEWRDALVCEILREIDWDALEPADVSGLRERAAPQLRRAPPDARPRSPHPRARPQARRRTPPPGVPAQVPVTDAAPRGALGQVLWLINEGSRDRAIERLETLVARYPDDGQLKRLFATLLIEAGDNERARVLLADAITTDALAFELHFLYGWALRALGRHDKANESFERAVFLEPSFALAHFELARTLHEAGRFDDALSCYGRALRADENPLGAALETMSPRFRETFPTNRSFIDYLCRENQERARERRPPLGSEEAVS